MNLKESWPSIRHIIRATRHAFVRRFISGFLLLDKDMTREMWQKPFCSLKSFINSAIVFHFYVNDKATESPLRQNFANSDNFMNSPSEIWMYLTFNYKMEFSLYDWKQINKVSFFQRRLLFMKRFLNKTSFQHIDLPS